MWVEPLGKSSSPDHHRRLMGHKVPTVHKHRVGYGRDGPWPTWLSLAVQMLPGQVDLHTHLETASTNCLP